MKTGIFLQVRLKSKRLPEKALLPLKGGSVFEHALRSLREIPAEVYTVLTDKNSLPYFEKTAESEGFSIFCGPSEDVLLRYAMAAHAFSVDRVIRATGDNPLVSPKMGRKIVDHHHRKMADMSHYLGIPLGTGVEVIQTEALFHCEREAKDPYEREHITTYIYRNVDRFEVLEMTAPEEYQVDGCKVSIDTEMDYELVSQIYEELYDDAPIEIDELIQWLKRVYSVELVG